jgi:hypothetical protein
LTFIVQRNKSLSINPCRPPGFSAKMTDYSKQAFEDATRAFEQLVGAKSFESVIEIQSQYAKKAYDTWVAEASKLGEMYAAVARDAYKPVEKAVTKRAS